MGLVISTPDRKISYYICPCRPKRCKMKKHINQQQRYEIATLKKIGYSTGKIAKELGVNKSSIGRELKRNGDTRCYNGIRAEQYADERKMDKPRKKIVTPSMSKLITEKLAQKWSPEQIKGRCDKEAIPMVCHESIYQIIWRDKANGGMLWKNLRHAHKKYRKRYGTKDRRGKIPNRISIDKRPEIVNNKERIGDWEIDTIIGKNHQGAIVTATERKTQFVLMAKLKSKAVKHANPEIINMFAPYKEKVLTITSDNGIEFFGHQYIAQKLAADYFFANPYHSWERGLNEYQNKLIRQYIPKKTNFNEVDQHQIINCQNELNKRPRKKLGYCTPNEVFLNKGVAFMS